MNFHRTADVYAVGLMLHEMITGKRPEAKQGGGLGYESINPAIDEIVKTATQTDPEDRYEDAEMMAESLLAARLGV